MPPTRRPPERFIESALRAIGGTNTVRKPVDVAMDLWYNKMSYKQRAKWLRGNPDDLSGAERDDARAIVNTDRATIILAKLLDHPEYVAMGAAATAGFLAPDLAQYLTAGLNNLWKQFWAATPFAHIGEFPSFPSLPGLGDFASALENAL